MTNARLPLSAPIDVDGRTDKEGLVTYYGKAVHVFDNVYQCVARVGDSLAVVEITATAAQ